MAYDYNSAISGGFEPLSQVNDPNTNTGAYQWQNSGYIWKDNGAGGVNYYQQVDNGTTNKLMPISREQFAQGTGQDVGAIEQWVAQNASTTTEQQPTTTALTDAGDGVGGSGTPARVDEAVSPLTGKVYNLADPGQFEAYQAEKNQWVNSQYEEQSNLWSTQHGRNKQDLETTKGNLQRSKDRFYGAGGDIGDWARGMLSIDKGYKSRNANIYSTYANLSPNGYQSSEGTNLDESSRLLNDAKVTANNQKADLEGEFNTTQTAIDRTAQDLARDDIEKPKYFQNWRDVQLGNNKVSADQAKADISNAASSASRIAANKPTFQEKAYNWLSAAAGLFSENPNIPKNTFNNLMTSQATKSGVGLTPGTNIYDDVMKLNNPTSQEDTDNIYKKYGLLT